MISFAKRFFFFFGSYCCCRCYSSLFLKIDVVVSVLFLHLPPITGRNFYSLRLDYFLKRFILAWCIFRSRIFLHFFTTVACHTRRPYIQSLVRSYKWSLAHLTLTREPGGCNCNEFYIVFFHNPARQPRVLLFSLLNASWLSKLLTRLFMFSQTVTVFAEKLIFENTLFTLSRWVASSLVFEKDLVLNDILRWTITHGHTSVSQSEKKLHSLAWCGH